MWYVSGLSNCFSPDWYGAGRKMGRRNSFENKFYFQLLRHLTIYSCLWFFPVLFLVQPAYAGGEIPVAFDDSYVSSEGGMINPSAPALLANDTDAEEESLTAAVDTFPSFASAFSLEADGSFSYTHDGSENLIDTFTYTASDGTGTSAPATVTININPINDGPQISSLAPTVATEDELYSYQVTVVDPDDSNNGTDLNFSLTNEPTGMTISSTGLIEWTPLEGETTSSSVTVNVADGGEDGAAAGSEIFMVTVAAVNDSPEIISTAPITAMEDVLYSYQVTVADPDDANNGTDLSFSLSNGPAGMTVSSTGLIEWTPLEGVASSGEVTLTVADGGEDGAAADSENFTLAVAAVNDPPVITSTAPIAATEDVLYSYQVTVADPDDTNNGTDLSFSLSNGPTGMTVSNTGLIEWTPLEGMASSGEVTVTVADGGEDGALTVSEYFIIAVAAVNDQPTAANKTITTNEDTAYVFQSSDFSFTDVDSGDALIQVRITSLESAGALQLNSVDVALDQVIPEAELGNLIFVPPQDANGAGYDSFQFRVHDGTAYSIAAYTMTVDVTAVSDAPSNDVVPEISGILEEGQILLTTTGSWTDNSNPSGTITYSYQWRRADDSAGTNLIPIPGATSSSYSITTADVVKYLSVAVTATANGDDSPAAISAASGPVSNNVPIISQGDGPLEVTMSEDGLPTAWSAPALDATDANSGDTLSWGIVSGAEPSHGTATVSGDGSSPDVFSYIPAADYHGTDSFVVQVSDGLATDTIQVSLTIDAVNDLPTATADTATVAEDSGTSAIDVLSNDSILPDSGETLVVIAVTQGDYGSVVITGGGSGLTYQPAPDFNGSDSFQYTIDDGNGGTAIADVSVTVTSVNDPPTAVDDDYSVSEGGSLNTATSILVNDKDVEGDSFTAELVSAPVNASHFDLNPDGTFSYTHDGSETFSDSFTYTANDNDGAGNVATVTITLTHQITIAWNPSFSPEVVGYEVSYGTESGEYGPSQDAGNKTEDIIAGLIGDTLYFIAVRAYDSNGVKSDYTEEILYRKSHPDNPGTISGKVEQYSDPVREAVSGLPVCAIDSDANIWADCALSQADGFYEIDNLPAGNYIVRALAENSEYIGLLGQYYPDATGQDAAEIISIGTGEIRAWVNFVLNQGAVIAGAFSYNGDPPAEDPIVYVENSESKYVYEGITQPSGSYAVSGLPPGDYRVRAETMNSGYIREFYKDAYDYDNSEIVETLLGLPALDIDFDVAEGGSISGRLIRQSEISEFNDLPLEGLWVYAFQEESGIWAGSGLSAADGSYAISGLTAGNYYVRVETGNSGYFDTFYGGTADSGSAVSVPVNVSETTNDINFRLVAGGSISGKVSIAADGSPFSGVLVFAHENASGSLVEKVATESDGTYIFPRLPAGNYWVRVETADMEYLDQYYDDAYDPDTALAIVVADLSETDGIDFSLIEGGSISGVVQRESDSQPLSGILLNAYDYSSGQWKGGAQTQVDGSYIINKLQSGIYKVRTETKYDSVYGEYFDNTYHNDLAAAVAVVVPQTTTNIDFLLTAFAGTDSDSDRLTDSDEINIYQTDVYSADTDGDGIDDVDEIAFWETEWNQDPDGDGRVNVVDFDSDNDGLADGYEYQHGSDPEDPDSVPSGVIAGTVFHRVSSNDELFKVFDLSGEMVFGTTSTAINIHSHYSGTELDALPGFVYSGRMMISNGTGGIGLTFLSQFPVSDTYYRLRRTGSGGAFYLAPHPHGYTVAGDIDTGVVPVADTWYSFKIEVQNTGSRTEIRASVWAEGTAEPADWQVDAYDDEPTRLTHGKIGVWSHRAGNKYWDDLRVAPMVSSTYLYSNGFEGYPAGSLPGNWVNIEDDLSVEYDYIPLSGVDMFVELYSGDPCKTPLLAEKKSINPVTGTYLFDGLDPTVESYYLITERNGFDYLNEWAEAFESSPFCKDAIPINISAGGRAGIDFYLESDEYPFAYDDTAFTNEDTVSAPIHVIGNDIDPDGTIDPEMVAIVASPNHGTAAAIGGGNLIYTPDPNFNGTDYFTYTVRDNQGAISEEATVTVTVEPVNDQPIAGETALDYQVIEGQELIAAANYSDPDGDLLTVRILQDPINGDLTLNPDTSFSYFHSGGDDRADSFSYQVTDGAVLSDITVVNIQVTSVNDNPPLARDDAYGIDSGGVLAPDAAAGLLINDTDADGDVLTAEMESPPSFAAAFSLNADGSFSYTHDSSASPTDSFSYRVRDGETYSNEAWVSIFIDSGNSSPTANSDTYGSLDEGGTLTVDAAAGVRADDVDAEQSTEELSVMLVSDVSHGELTLAADGSFIYNHDGSESTEDSFTYQVSDGELFSNVATATIAIQMLNDIPTAKDDAVSMVEDTTAKVDVLANDRDADGDSLSILVSVDPADGTAVVTADNSIIYTPDANYFGSDSFVYSVSDGELVAEARVTVTVGNINDVPEAFSLPVGTFEDTPVAVMLTGTDLDYDVLSFSVIAGPNHGTLSGTAPDLTYTPDPNFNGTDSIAFKVNDGLVDSIQAMVSIAVTAVNDQPAVGDIPDQSVAEGSTFATINLNDYVSDVENSDADITWTVSGSGEMGVSIDASRNAAVLIPHADWNGSETLVFRATDGGGLFAENAAVFTVTPVNDAPTAITLSSSNIDENLPSGTLVGIFAAVDVDAGDSHTYSLVPGSGDTDNGWFAITNNQILTAATFDHETRSSYSIRVRTTDQNNAVFEEEIAIAVSNVNESPTIQTAGFSLSENTENSTPVGSVAASDPDAGDSLTYGIIDGNGDGVFAIDSNSGQISVADNGSLDFETTSNYVLTVAVTDLGGLSDDGVITINVTDANDAPTDVTIDNNNIDENQPPGSLVGTLAAVDEDAGDSHTYALATTGGDNFEWIFFTIAGNELRTRVPFDYEFLTSYSFLVIAQDQSGAIFEKQFTIDVNNVNNEAPLGITMNNSEVSENQQSGTIVGTFSTTDQDSGQTHSYSFAGGPGDDDNVSFTIVGDELQTAVSFDFETQSIYNIRVRTDDLHGGVFEEELTITVIDANDEPTAIELNNNVVAENRDAGSVVGILATLDEDTADDHTYSLVSGTGDDGNGWFEISGSEIRTAASFDHETRSSYSIRVRTVDQGSSVLEEQFTIAVLNVNDSPVISSTAPSSATEELLYSYVVTVNDQDDANNGSDLTFSLSNAPSGMTISSTGRIEWTPLEGVASSGEVTLTVADGGEDASAAATELFTIAVTMVNDPPVITSTAAISATEDVLYSYQVTVSDPDDANNGTDLSFSLTNAPAGMTISDTGLIEWTPLEGVLTSGNVTATVVDGGEDGAAAATEIFTIAVTSVNDAPIISSTAPAAATEDVLYSYQVVVDDPDDANNGTDLTYSLMNAPIGMTISDTGLIEWTPLEGVTTSGDVTVTVTDGGEDGAAAGSETFILAVTAVSDAPVVSYIADQSIAEGSSFATVNLDDYVDDIENTDAEITWTASGNSDLAVTIDASRVATITIADEDWNGSETVIFRATDAGALYAEDVATFTVTAVNDAPVIASAAPTTATEDVLYSYQVTVADPDDANNGTDLVYSLANEPAGMTISNTGLVGWTPLEGVLTSGAVTVTVADGGEDGAAAAVEIFTLAVTAVNDAPLVSDIPDQSIAEGLSFATINLDDHVSDIDNLDAEMTWTASGNSDLTVTIVDRVATITIPDAEWNGSETITFRATDPGALFAEAAVGLTVTAVNDAPEISSTAPSSATEDVLYSYQVTVADPDDANNGTDLTFSLTNAPAGMTVSVTGLIQWAPLEGVANSGEVTVTAADGGEDGATAATEIFTIAVAVVNDPPVITSMASTAATEDLLYSYQVIVDDPDDANNGTDLNFNLIDVPTGMTVSNTGLIEWTPLEGVLTSGNVTVTAADGGEDGAAAASEIFSIAVTSVNDAPVISSTAPAGATEDVLYSYQVVVDDPDDANNGTDLTYSLINAPAGMTISGTGLIEWTPLEGVTTSGEVTVTVTDGGEDGSAAGSETFTLAVTAVNDAPVVSDIADQSIAEGSSFATVNLDDYVDDIENTDAEITWTASGNSDLAVTIDAGRVATITNADEDWNGSETIIFRATDAGGQYAEDAGTFTVTAVNDAPVIASAAPTTAIEDVLYSYQVIVDDPDDANNGTDLIYSLANEPAGMTISNTGLIGWTPLEGVLTSGAVTVTVADGGEDGAAAAVEIFTVAVTTVNDAPLVSDIPDQSIAEGLSFATINLDDHVSDIDTTDAEMTWTASGNSVLAVSIVDRVATITIPDAEWNGTETITFRATDPGALFAEDAAGLTVTAVNDAPQISSTAPSIATEDVLYGYQVEVADPDDANNGTDLAFSLTNAPAGMTVSGTGLIQWTPLEGVASSGEVTVTVADGGEDGATAATEIFSIAVAVVNDPPVITSMAPTAATEDVLYSYQVAVNDPDDTNNGADLTFSLSNEPAGMAISSTGLIEWTPLEGVATSGNVTVTVSDGGEDAAAAAIETFTIEVTAVNDAPSITSAASTSATEDVLYSYQVIVDDPDDANNGTDLIFNLIDAPTGMTVSNTGLVEWTPLEGETSSGDVTVSVVDGGEDGAAAATEIFTIAVTSVNDAPVITSTAPASATEDVLYSYPVTVDDPDDANNGTDLTFSLINAPTGMTISSTGLIEWTPLEGVMTSGEVTVSVTDGGEDGSAAGNETFTLAVTAVNDAPVVSDIADQSIAEGSSFATVNLDDYVDDIDNTDAEMTWTASGNSDLTVTIDASRVATITIADEDWNGSETIIFRATDAGDQYAEDAATFTATAVNDAPVIASAAPITATEDVLYSYQVTVDDPDDANNGTDLIYSLANEPAGMTISNTGLIGWTPLEGVLTSGAVTVTVADGGEDGAAVAVEIFTVAVTAVNDVPVITSAAPATATEDELYVYQVTVADPDDTNNGADLTFNLTEAPSGMTISGTGLIEWTPLEGVMTSGAVTVTVVDGGEDGVVAGTEIFTVAVTAVNDPPVISSTASVSAAEDLLYSYQVTVADPDDINNGTDLNFILSNEPAGMTISNTGLIEWIPEEGVTTSGDVTVTVADGGEDGAAAAAEIFSVAVVAVNDAPVIISTAPATATEDTLYTYPLMVNDPDDANNGIDLSFSLTNEPAGMTISGTGIVKWTPTEGVTSSGEITVSVTDGGEDGAVAATERFTVAVTVVNDAPLITSSASTTATEDVLYSYQVIVGDPDDANNGTDLIFSLTDAPIGMTVSNTGLVEWTPLDGQTSSGSVTLTVVDGREDGAAAATELFTIAVTSVNDAPVITSTAPTAATEDVLYSYQVVVDDPDDANNGTELTFSLINAPAGMTISGTGLIEWTPLEGVASSGEVTVTVADGGEDGADPRIENFTLMVTAVNDAPVVSDIADQSIAEGSSFTIVNLDDYVDDIDDTDVEITWTALGNSDLAVTIDASRVATITIPHEDWNGSETIIFRATDAGSLYAEDAATFVATAVNDAPEISSTAPSSATEDLLYSYAVTVNDPDDANNGTDLTFSLTNTPAGMTISDTGLIEWTPLEGVASSGEVTVTVADGGEDSVAAATEVFTVAVIIVNDAPVITSTASATATEDTLYTYQLAIDDPDDANNGADLTFSLSNEPAGMTISGTGLIEWTPIEAVITSGNVTVTVSDGGEDAAAAATEIFTIAVTAVNDPPLITSAAPISAIEDVLYSYQITVADPDDANNGTDLAFSLTDAPTGMTVSNTGLVEWTPLEGQTSSGGVTLTVADGGEDGAAVATELFTVSVTSVNDAPVITSTAPTAATEDVIYSYQVVVDDPDDANNGTDLTFSLINAPAGMTISNTGLIEWTPLEAVASSGEVTVTVTDGGEDGAPAGSENFTLAVTSVNDAPLVSDIGDQSIAEGSGFATVILDDYVDDIDNPDAEITWTASGNSDLAVTIDASRVATITIPHEDWNGSEIITFRATDAGALYAEDAATFTATAVNDAPVIASAAPTTATEDIPYSYQVTVADPDDSNNGTDLSYSLTNEPAGMTISNTGLIGWTPLEGVLTSGAVTVTVADGGEDGAAAAVEIFTVAVAAVNDAPLITSVAPATATEDELYSYPVTVVDPDDAANGTDLTFSLTDAPSGMTISATGLIEWIPLEGVTTSGAVTVRVADGGEDATAAATEIFTIAVASVNDAPLITSTASNSATEDLLYSYQVIVADADDANNGADLSFGLTNAPPGMAISGTGLIEWTPLEGEASSGEVTVTVADGGEDGAVAATEVFTVAVIAVNDAPVITSTAPATGTEDTLYTYQLVVNDPDDANNGADLTFSLSNEPAGMTISSTGLIEWTPNEGVTSSGEVTASVTDGGEDGAVATTERITIGVTSVNDAPSITSAASSTATEDVPYSYQVIVDDPDDANNGTDLIFNLTDAPTGMTVSNTGLIEWTPLEGETSSGAVTVTVADGGEDGAAAATELFTISITSVNDAPVITSTAPTAATEDVPYSYLVAVSDPDDANNGTDLSFSLANEPAGMTIGSTGVVEWTPLEGVTSSGEVTVTVADGGEDGAAAAEIFTIAVTIVNDPPVITSTAPEAATEDMPYSY